MQPEHKYLHLEHVSAYRFSWRGLLGLMIFAAFVFCFGFFVGGRTSYENGRRAGVNEVESAILVSIREGEDFAIDKTMRVRLVVRVRDSAGMMRRRGKARAEMAERQFIRYRALSIYGDEEL